MKHHFFMIPVKDSGQAEDELNAFYAQHRIISVEKHFVADGSNSFWSLCLSCTDNEAGLLNGINNSRITSKSKIDYKDVLNEADFALFAHCRDLRKVLAERDGVPIYALFTNEQLAKMVEQRIHSKQGLLGLEGVGQARVDKYGEVFLSLLNSHTKPNETSTHQP
jgi:superfamily II DNA helicase RecQ